MRQRPSARPGSAARPVLVADAGGKSPPCLLPPGGGVARHLPALNVDDGDHCRQIAPLMAAWLSAGGAGVTRWKNTANVQEEEKLAEYANMQG